MKEITLLENRTKHIEGLTKEFHQHIVDTIRHER